MTSGTNMVHSPVDLLLNIRPVSINLSSIMTIMSWLKEIPSFLAKYDGLLWIFISINYSHIISHQIIFKFQWPAAETEDPYWKTTWYLMKSSSSVWPSTNTRPWYKRGLSWTLMILCNCEHYTLWHLECQSQKALFHWIDGILNAFFF